ncbi:MAG: DNA polymerase III subunit gamma/tau, partial [Bacteroidales bacterium]|nr:DNA polymerase III subunit gamma/tau [Bacteroidales bacterium]
MNLYNKYRSQKFDEVVGQEHIVTVLKNAIIYDKVSHAYLFSGPRGTGKTTLARLLAKSLNCQDRKKNNYEPCNVCASCKEITQGFSMDIIEIDAASNRGINEIRSLRDKIHFVSSGNKYKIFIIDEVHMLTPEAFNALLKTLEEPPKNVIFILATTELHKVPETIISRTQSFNFTLHNLDNIVLQLEKIAT